MRTKSLQAWRVTPEQCLRTTELLAAEAALHVRVNGIAYSTTVRTPGEDAALARGLLFTEGVIPNPRALLSYREIPDPETGLTACIEVTAAARDIAKEIEHRRSAMGSASCGLCGMREPEEILPGADEPPVTRAHTLALEDLVAMRQRMEAAQTVFVQTGGCHGAAAFDARGALLAFFEDIGRHNAVDKVVGDLLQRERLDEARVLFISGRISYEIAFKAFRAGFPILVGVSAPSTMAVEMAGRFGITIIGYCREDRATIYTHEERLRLPAHAAP